MTSGELAIMGFYGAMVTRLAYHRLMPLAKWMGEAENTRVCAI